MNAIALDQGCSLTQVDWRVVEIARMDGPGSIDPEGRVTRFLRAFLALPRARRLASDRAEALRRFCVRAWYGNLIPSNDVRPLIDTGYTRIDVLEILTHVARRRGFTPSLQEDAI